MNAAIIGLCSLMAVAISTPRVDAKPPKAKSQVYSGYIVDKMCAGSVTRDKATAYEKAAAHDKPCLIEPPCLSSGYGIVTPDGTWLPFNAAGDKKAEKVALATKKDDHIAIRVSGQVKDGTLYVSQISER